MVEVLRGNVNIVRNVAFSAALIVGVSGCTNDLAWTTPTDPLVKQIEGGYPGAKGIKIKGDEGEEPVVLWKYNNDLDKKGELECKAYAKTSGTDKTSSPTRLASEPKCAEKHGEDNRFKWMAVAFACVLMMMLDQDDKD